MRRLMFLFGFDVGLMQVWQGKGRETPALPDAKRAFKSMRGWGKRDTFDARYSA